MRAFLSHSSKDKYYVEKISSLLRPGSFELDSLTFEKGELNVSEIISALSRSDLFCLFLSENSIGSSYVDFEQRISLELLGAGKLQNFLTICLDETAFSKLAPNARFFNAIRRAPSPEAAAHMITGKLISAAKAAERVTHPFIGRDMELRELEEQALDFGRPKLRALFISGNSGTGRRSIAEHFYARQYPHVLRSHPRFEVESYAGYDEIYRQVIFSLKPTISMEDFLRKVASFSKLDDADKAEEVAALVNASLRENLVVFALDAGGLLHQSGGLSPEFSSIIDRLEDSPHPPLVIISPRMTPRKLRRKEKDVAYLPVGALSRDNATRLMSWAMRSIEASPAREQIENLVDLADLHPFNVYEIKDRVSEIGVDAFLGDTSNFIAWKHKESSEYLRGIEIDETEKKVLGILLFAPELDFRSLVKALATDEAEVSQAIQRLVDLHVLRYNEDRFSISPPLRIAVERDPRVKLKGADHTDAIRRLAQSLTVGFEDGTAPVALADAAVLSSLEAGRSLGVISLALLLPSHRVWLARQHYDATHWQECLRLTQDAIRDRSRLSSQGFIAACRFLCLAAARLGDQVAFKDGISKLKSTAYDNWSKANLAFLEGFNDRLQGKIFDAERHMKQAFEFNPRDRSTARELGSIYLILGDNENAEKYARVAYELATNNPYTIDILVSALVRKLGGKCVGDVEVEELLARLEVLDNEEQKSFSSTRKAEIELLHGSPHTAEKHIQEAMRRTKYLFEPKLLNAKILLRKGNKPAAADAISELERLTSWHGRSENKANRRQVLMIKAEYLIETRRFSEARGVFDDRDCFSDIDRASETKKIDLAEAYTQGQ